MTIAIWAALAVPALLAALSLARPSAPMVRHTPAAAAVAVLASGVAMLALSPAGQTTAGGLLRVDGLTAYMLTTVGAVAVVATGGAATDRPHGRFSALMCLFLATMSLAVLADDLGVLWVAVEATTITTAFLVAHGGGIQPEAQLAGLVSRDDRRPGVDPVERHDGIVASVDDRRDGVRCAEVDPHPHRG